MISPTSIDSLLGKWVVNVKGNFNSFEISVLLDTNQHGKDSRGWFGNDKICIMNSGQFEVEMTQELWDHLIQIATQIAARLSGEVNKEKTT